MNSCLQVGGWGPFLSLTDDELMPKFNLETLEYAPDEDSNANPEDQMWEGDQLLCTSVLLLSEEV